jgi:WD40 repeat protein
MSNPTPPVIASGVEGYPSLAALRDAHGALLEQRRAHGDTPDLFSAAERFIQRGVATGALLDGSEDQRAAQSLLNYWANMLYRADRGPLDATLAEFDPLLAPALPDALCPYLGLDAFSETSAERFFGRQELIARLLDRLRRHCLIAVVGPSGSGKSSVVRAGLIPALRGGALPGSETWRYLPPIVPGSDPLANLARLFQPEDTTAKNAKDAKEDKTMPSALFALSAVSHPVVLVVDQFEEVFTLCDDVPARQAFIANLLGLANAPEPQHRVILTMRSDFETFVARVPELQPLFERGRVQVTPLSAAELREAIEAPAAQVGLKFEQGVVDLLLQDILGEPAGLPLLQFTLLKLWEQRERNRVTRAAYDRVGGGRLALARSADAFYQGLIPEDQVTAKRILLRMVRPGEGLEITSQRVRRTALLQGGEDPGRVERVLGRLIDARLVRLTAGETSEDDQVEVAHEALVRNWPTLVDWLEEEKAAIATRRRLESRAAEWARLGRGEAGLLDEVEWREAERWLQGAEAQFLGYDAALPAFVAVSRAATERAEREHEAAHLRELDQARALAEAQRKLAQAQARTARRLRRAAVTLIVLLAVAVLAAGYAFIQQSEATKQQHVAQIAEATALADASARATAQAQAQREAATARAAESTAQLAQATTTAALVTVKQQDQLANAEKWAAIAGNSLGGDPVRSLLLALQAQAATAAFPLSRTTEIINTLEEAVVESRVQKTFQGNTKAMLSIAFSPDGERIATGNVDGIATIWDVKSGKTLRTLQVGDKVTGVAFSPVDRETIATVTDEGAIQLWNTTSGVSPSGWDAISGSPIIGANGRPAPDQARSLYDVTFSPDGNLLGVASADGTGQVWDIQRGIKIHVIQHLAAVGEITFSHDGKWIATASADGTAQICDLEGNPQRLLLNPRRTILSSDDNRNIDVLNTVAFSPDDTYVATAGNDKIARIWDRATGAKVHELQGHQGTIYAVTFSPDGEKLATASRDQTIKLWSVASGRLLLTLVGHTNTVNSIAFSPDRDGKQLASASWDGTANVWNATVHHIAEIEGVVFSPDSTRFASASQDGTAKVWDAASGERLLTLKHYPGAQRESSLVLSITFNYSGTQLVTTGTDSRARLWNAQTGDLLAAFPSETDSVKTMAVIGADFSRDDLYLATVSVDGIATIWDVISHQQIQSFSDPSGLHSIRFSRDGQTMLTSGSDGRARVWDVKTGTLRFTLNAQQGTVYDAEFSPDGKHIATAGEDGLVKIWDTTTPSSTLVMTLTGHLNLVVDVAFSPDGRTLASASWDGTAKIWDVATGRELFSFDHHTQVNYVAFSPDGGTLATASNDVMIHIYPLRLEDLIAQARARVTRPFTAGECRAYGIDPCPAGTP